MIYTTDQILINGINQIYNGYIYNVDYQPSFGQNPSYCTLNLISEDKTYSITDGDLQVLSPDTIQLGTGITLSMFPVEYELDDSPDGGTLQIKYIDTSIILDKKIVVLNGRQGNDGTANKPINPLPIPSGSGNASSFNYPNDKFPGSCYIPVGKELLKIGETPYQVLDVVYTFPDLCDAINNNGITIALDSLTIIQNSSQYYATSYIGSLRNVLALWCTDLGYSFYWENNQLHFIDLTTPLVLNTAPYDALVKTAIKTRVSIEDTVGRVACAFYKQDYNQDTIPFSQTTSETFKVLSLSQLGFSKDQIDSVTAAFCGETIFWGYHFLLNNTYGKSVLGITSDYLIMQGGDAVSMASPAFLNDAAGSSNFYWFVQKTKVDIATQNYSFYHRLATYVGKYYILPMTYGDYKQISNAEYPIRFCSGNVKASQTPLGELAAFLNGNSPDDQTLKSFLQGTPYIAPVANDPSRNPNLGNNAITADTDAISDVIPYDTEPGYAIVSLENQSWFYNGVPINPQAFQNTLTNDGTYNFIPKERPTIETTVQKCMSNKYGAIYNGAPENGIYEWDIIDVLDWNGNYGPLQFSIQSPELLNPFVHNHLTLNTPYLAITPKIEEFFRSEYDKTGNHVDCHSNVIKNELNYRVISNSDMTALGHPISGRLIGNRWGVALAYPAAPNPANLDEAFILFTKNLTFSKTTPTVDKTYVLPYINIPNNVPISLGNGLISLSIRIDEKGINSTYVIGTRLMQVPSVEVIRANISFQNKTNESRYVPYGYNPVVTI